MTDKDTFAINCNGGDMHGQATPKGVSSLDAIVKLYDDQDNLIAQVDSDNINIEYLYAQGLAAGNNYIEIMSHGDYGQLGPYNLLVQDESAGPPSSGRLEVKINSSTDDAE